MGKVRLSVAVAATILGILVLLFSFMQPDRPTLEIVIGLRLIACGAIRLCVGETG